MNKRISKKLEKKIEVTQRVSDAVLEIKDLTQTGDFMAGRITELEEKCTRYVDECSKYKHMYEVEYDRASDLLADRNQSEAKNARYLEEIRSLENEKDTLSQRYKECADCGKHLEQQRYDAERKCDKLLDENYELKEQLEYARKSLLRKLVDKWL